MPDMESLKAEWLTLCKERAMDPYLEIQKRETKRGTVVRVCGPHACHESYDGVEAAMELLVDSFRTRVEDLEETHLAIVKWRRCDIKAARRYASQCAREVREANPDAPGEKRDALLLEHLAQEQKEHDAAVTADAVAVAEAATVPAKVPAK